MDKPTIVIIDDDPGVRKTLSDILGTTGYDTLAAKDGAEGLALFRNHVVQAALVDLGLPDMSGLEVLARIKADFPSTEAIILTGNATLDSAITATNAGAFSYLLKPYEVDQLLLHVRHAVEKREAAEKIRLYQEHLEELVRERTRELENARDEAEAGSRVKTEFIANMSHEIRTPLNSIVGFSEVLKDGLSGELNEKQKEYVDHIHSSGRQLLGLIMDILSYSELEAGGMRLNKERFPLKDLLRSSLAMVSEQAANHGIELRLQGEPPVGTELEADPEKLRQVLFSLLSNAVKFTPDGGAVSVRARLIGDCGLRIADCPSPQPSPQRGEEGSQSEIRNLKSAMHGKCIEISVHDTGIGIKPEDLPKLFKEFTQLEAPFTKKYRGTGLGLALARRLVVLHGGTICVESEFGKGSTFIVTLPLTQAREGLVADAQRMREPEHE